MASLTAAAVAALVVTLVWVIVPGIRSTSQTLAPAGTGAPTDEGQAPLTEPSAVPTASVIKAGVRVLSRIPTSDAVVFVGIDDGYVRLPEVARMLGERHAPLSLFVTASSLEEEPDYFRGIVAGGATVENHTITHPLLTSLSEESQRREICGASDTAARLIGRRPTLFRPPFGAYNAATLRAVHDCGMDTVVLWDVAVNDGHVQFQQGDRLLPGDIVLMHFRSTGVEDLSALLTAIDEAGLRIASLEDYISRLPAPTALPVVPPRTAATTQHYTTRPWRTTWSPPAVITTPSTASSTSATGSPTATTGASATLTGTPTPTTTTASSTATATATPTVTATTTTTATPKPTTTRTTAPPPPPPPTTAPPATETAAPTP